MRTTDQNALFHCWIREITIHLQAAKVKNVSDATIKELILLTLGNTVDLLGTQVAMRSSKYKRSEADLTEAEHYRGFISMDGLLTKMQVWSATDLSLELSSPNEDPA